jgi:hypothetical protein
MGGLKTWLIPANIPIGAAMTRGETRTARMRKTITSTMRPIVFSVDVAMKSLLIPALIYYNGAGFFYLFKLLLTF